MMRYLPQIKLNTNMKKLLVVTAVLFSTVIVVAQTETKFPDGLKVGDKAPDFTLTNEKGKSFNLYSSLKNGKVVMVFYRGQWCPFCNKQLSQLNDSLQLLNDKGASIVALSPEIQENIAKTVSKTKASFPVLFDDGMKVMQAYKVNFTVDEKTVEKYKGYGIEFDKANGSNGANLPVPATYIIGNDGIVEYVYFNTDYRKRVTVKELLEKL
jgi:peroxiredoxin